MKKKKAPIEQSKRKVASASDYAQTLMHLKQKIQESQIKATMSVNKELIKLYWHIGKTIVERQKKSAWGSSVIERLASDLQNFFPGIEGFSKLNVFRMQAFYRAYEKVSQPVTQLKLLPIFGIPWGHNIVLIHKLKKQEERLWYAQKAVDNGWSRSMLETWIKSKRHNRQGRAVTNFSKTLPVAHSDMAQQSLKDPYLFDFLTLQEEHLERAME